MGREYSAAAPALDYTWSHNEQTELSTMNREQVEQFANDAKILATEQSLQSRCVDGRYEGLDNFPVIAKPGGDVGDIMTALAAINLLGKEVSPESVLSTVVESAGGPNKFNFHTDEHAEHDHTGTGMGCGHIKLAKQNASDYGLKQEQIDFVVNQLSDLVIAGAHQKVLHGDHAEQVVIVVDSEKYGLKPMLHKDGATQEAFIYQKTLHGQQLDKLAQMMAKQIFSDGSISVPQIRQALSTAFDQQLGQTLERLAAGLPVYEVSISDDGTVGVQ